MANLGCIRTGLQRTLLRSSCTAKYERILTKIESAHSRPSFTREMMDATSIHDIARL